MPVFDDLFGGKAPKYKPMPGLFEPEQRRTEAGGVLDQAKQWSSGDFEVMSAGQQAHALAPVRRAALAGAAGAHHNLAQRAVGSGIGPGSGVLERGHQDIDLAASSRIGGAVADLASRLHLMKPALQQEAMSKIIALLTGDQNFDANQAMLEWQAKAQRASSPSGLGNLIGLAATVFGANPQGFFSNSGGGAGPPAGGGGTGGSAPIPRGGGVYTW